MARIWIQNVAFKGCLKLSCVKDIKEILKFYKNEQRLLFNCLIFLGNVRIKTYFNTQCSDWNSINVSGGPVPSSPNIPAALLKLRVRQQSGLLSTGHGAAAVSRIFGNFFQQCALPFKIDRFQVSGCSIWQSIQIQRLISVVLNGSCQELLRLLFNVFIRLNILQKA